MAPAAEEAQLVRDVLLLDGTTLRLRAPAPEDFEDIKAFYDALSPESRYLRFHGYGRTDLPARALAEARGADRVALIARHDHRIVATTQYEGLREPGVAEVAFAVADDFQGRGTGTRMLEQLAEIAATRDVHRFIAYVLPQNAPMLAVFEHAGYAIQRTGSFDEITVSLDITPTEAVVARIDERDHIAAVLSIRPVLAPSSVAVVGDDEVAESVRASINAGGYRGAIRSLEEGPELVIVAGAADELVGVAARAAEVGAKSLLVLTIDQGRDSRREEQLLELVRAGGLRLVGPSSLGVLNTDPEVKLDATFAPARVTPGRLAVCSRSGAIGIGLLGHAARRRLGVSSFISLGDRIDVSTNDLLELWEDDARTAAVVLYLETFGHPERFSRVAARVSRRKPILAVKGRRAADSARGVALSHTAAALRGDAVVDALFYRSGILRFRSGGELFNAAEFFESQPLPLGRRVGIISNSGGVATLAADACASRGLEATRQLVTEVGANAEAYAGEVAAALADAGVDAVMAYYVERRGGDPHAVLAAVADAWSGWHKPLVSSIIAGDGSVPGSEQGVPNLQFPEECAGVLARAVERREWLSRPLGERRDYRDLDIDAARGVVDAALADGGEGGRWLSLEQTERLLRAYAIEILPSEYCDHIEKAVACAQGLRAPVALKAAFAAPALAADIDAVLLGLEGDAAVRAGWRELERRVNASGRSWLGVVVQRLAPGGADLLVGTLSDVDLGPVMAVGLGGRHAGLAGTTAFRALPGTDLESDELIDASPAATAQIEGFRRRAPLDRHALRELVLRFAALVRDCPALVEADLNPVRLMARGATVLDARIRVQRRPEPQRIKTW